MKDEWWLKAAISDDKLVAELLLRLKESPSPSASATATATANAAASDSSPPTFAVLKTLPPTWGIRQPRSSVEKKRDSQPRRSPTTPLSWGCVGGSGGGAATSPSDGYEDSSSHHHHHHERLPQSSSDRFRSKISASAETPATSSKRPRRKKTFAELKEEENSLLKERTYLKRELATLRLTLKEQRSLNENLKRRKLDLHVESGVKSEPSSNEPAEQQNANQDGASEAASSNGSRQVKSEDTSEPDLSSPAQRGVTSEEPIFVLPDLNMAPDEDCCPEPIAVMC